MTLMAMRSDPVVTGDGEVVGVVFMEEGWAMVKDRKKNAVKYFMAPSPGCSCEGRAVERRTAPPTIVSSTPPDDSFDRRQTIARQSLR